jgi:hypothetical protein
MNLYLGNLAGSQNTSGNFNTFVGSDAGENDANGSADTFIGAKAGHENVSGSNNTFVGTNAGNSNTTGSFNTFSGNAAGSSNTTGIDNTFTGVSAGVLNRIGSLNTFYGSGAGGSNTSGMENTFYGWGAGSSNATGNNDIYIGNLGPVSGTESSTIRIGGDILQGFGPQTATYVAGIYGSTVSGLPIYINANGQLGTQSSSLRFKDQIQDMGDSTSGLMKLRPVTFVYKPEYANGDASMQYGLIAEEVAKVYPELVAYDADGKPYSVRYQYLSTMLLNEVQKQYQRAESEARVVKQQEETINDLEQRLSRLEKLVGQR